MQHLSQPTGVWCKHLMENSFKKNVNQTRCSCSQKGTAGCSRSCCLDHLEYFITFRIRMYKNIKTHQSAHKCGD